MSRRSRQSASEHALILRTRQIPVFRAGETRWRVCLRTLPTPTPLLPPLTQLPKRPPDSPR